MATWIAHLRIAEALLEQINGLDAPQFYIGNIAPDSGIPDENWEHFDPPKQVTHFMPASQKSSFDILDAEFYRGYLQGLTPAADDGRFSGRMGYFFHLITDNLWWRWIGLPTQKRFKDQFEADPKFIWTVKEDWYGQDFIYVRDHPQCAYWTTFLHVPAPRCELDFLPTAAIERNIHYIQEYYQRQDEEIQARYHLPYLYLTKEQMDGFVDGTIRQIRAIYHLLWLDGRQPADNITSTLEMLPVLV
jgi:hypothetical protein